jgi:prepilin-type N-terminal cleavage/methylation domain-containing protein/prepilin-type processing-associated H-X9-DG protein
MAAVSPHAVRRGWPIGPHQRRRVKRFRGFTLVELLVVIAILGVLVALLLPAVQAAREASRRQTCMSHLKQIALGISHYESAIGRYPAGRVGCDDTADVPLCPPGLPSEKKTAASGFVTILPYLELRSLYDQLSVDRGGLWNRNVDDLAWWYGNPMKASAILQRVPIYVCPSDTAEPVSDVYAPVLAATGSYALVQGTKGPTSPRTVSKYDNDGLFMYVARRRGSEVTDGASNTLMVGEVIMADVWESSNTWTYARLNSDSLRTTEFALNTPPGAGSYYESQNGAFASHHPGGALFAYADGHVDVVRTEIDLVTYRALSTVAGDDLPVFSASGP